MVELSYFLIDLIAPASAIGADPDQMENGGASSPLTPAITELVGGRHAAMS